MMTASVVPTVSATPTRITAAIVAPTCGIRSSSPVITASTIGNGIPSTQAETPATVPATIEIATLPISDDDTAVIEFSSTGRQRASTAGGVKPNSQSVIVGRSISRNSARNVSVTSDRMEPNTPPAMPSSAFAASGSPAASSLSALRIFVVGVARGDDAPGSPAWTSARPSSPGSCLVKSTISSHTGPAAASTIANTSTNSAANTTSAARPRPQPRRTRAPPRDRGPGPAPPRGRSTAACRATGSRGRRARRRRRAAAACASAR